VNVLKTGNALKTLWLVFLVFLTAMAAQADDRGTPDEAKAMVQDAVNHVKEVGAEKAYEEFTTPGNKWHNKDIYLFCYRFDGTSLCHGANKALVGKNLIDLKSADGQPLIKNLIELASKKGSGWIDYKWTHPTTKKIEDKSSWVMRLPGSDALIGAGIYKQ